MRLATRADSSADCASRAIVIGGGMAGLLAARVLANYFAQVTLVERDRYPESPNPRAGLPQSRHLHILLARGQQALEHLFPGIGAELIRDGAARIDAAGDIAWLTPAGWAGRFASEIRSVACSRPLIDHAVRRRLGVLENLRILEKTEATGLQLLSGCNEVSGVTVRRRGAGAAGEEETTLAAGLVVDASGRDSRTPQWLAERGFASPLQTTVNPYLGYASRVYRSPVGLNEQWKCLYVQMAPPVRTRGGVIFAIEGDRWMVTLGGIGGDYPPTDDKGFLDFMGSLASPDLLEAVSGAEPISAISGFRAIGDRWFHYERMSRRPEGLLVMGDAACTFNPVYGQGMTMAALAALALDETLRASRRGQTGQQRLQGLAGRFQNTLARLNKAPWVLATSEDQRSPRLDGPRAEFSARVMHGYLDRVIARSVWDPVLRMRFLRVLHMIESPRTLLRPDVAMKVLLQSRRTGVQNAGHEGSMRGESGKSHFHD